jgi:FkbM family methyltransferase
MPRINKSDLLYAVRHPFQAFRYLVSRDNISYKTCSAYLPPDPIIVEAGAYDGSNTRDFCRYWPGCQIYAFEPVPSAYCRLLEVANEFPTRIHPQNMALGSHTKISEMHVSAVGPSGGEQSSSLLAPASTREEFPHVDFGQETVAVRVTRLDQWASALHLKRVDFLWFDMQGMELSALEGCGNLLSTVSAIHCEVQNIALYEGSPPYPQIRRWLEKRGFRVAREAVFRRGGNVFFVR